MELLPPRSAAPQDYDLCVVGWRGGGLVQLTPDCPILGEDFLKKKYTPVNLSINYLSYLVWTNPSIRISSKNIVVCIRASVSGHPAECE